MSPTPAAVSATLPAVSWRTARNKAAIYASPAAIEIGLLSSAQLLRVEAGVIQPTLEQVRRAKELYGVPPECRLVADEALADSRDITDDFVPMPVVRADFRTNTRLNSRSNHASLDYTHRNSLISPVAPAALAAPAAHIAADSTVAFRPADLIAAREARGWSIEEVGRRLDVTGTTASHLETRPQTVSGNLALKAMDLYGIDPATVRADGRGDDGLVVVRVKFSAKFAEKRRNGERTDGATHNDQAAGSPDAGPLAGHQPRPADLIELVPSPAPGYLMGRTIVDRDALQERGGELVPASAIWFRYRPDLPAPSLNIGEGLGNGLSKEYRERMLDFLLHELRLSQNEYDLSREVWVEGRDRVEAGKRIGLAPTTTKAYYYKIKGHLRLLWQRAEVRQRAAEIFAEVYGVEAGMGMGVGSGTVAGGY